MSGVTNDTYASMWIKGTSPCSLGLISALFLQYFGTWKCGESAEINAENNSIENTMKK